MKGYKIKKKKKSLPLLPGFLEASFSSFEVTSFYSALFYFVFPHTFPLLEMMYPLTHADKTPRHTNIN